MWKIELWQKWSNIILKNTAPVTVWLKHQHKWLNITFETNYDKTEAEEVKYKIYF